MDVLNVISIKDKSLVALLRKIFDPIKMAIDRNNGLFNRKLMLIKDQMIGLIAFNKKK